MKFKNLKIDDVFHFEDDNQQKEHIVVFVSKTIVQADALHNSASLCITKGWDYIAEKNVVVLYNKSK